MLFKLAWRNLWRHKIRSSLTLAAISFATAILVFFIGLQQSSYEATINANISLFHGHFQLQHQQFNDDHEIRDSFTFSEENIARISQLPHVAAVSSRGQAFGVLSTPGRSYAGQIIGVVPQSEPGVSTISGVIRTGTYLQNNTAYEAVVGQDLARNLKLTPGSELTLLSQARDGSVAAAVFTVVGIFETGSRDLDRSTVEIPLAIFDEVFTMEQQVHSVVVKAVNNKHLPQLEAQLHSLISDTPSVRVLNWEDLLPGLRQAIELDMAAGWIFFLSLVLIVGFSVVNTFLMSVLERTREFGVMLALGERPSRISALIALECSLLSLVGVLSGIVIGGAFIVYFGIYGFHIPGTEEIMRVWNLPLVLYTHFSVSALTQGPGIILIASLLAIIYPIIKTLRLEAIEALNAD